MSTAYFDIAFTPAVQAMQTAMGSRLGYARLDNARPKVDGATLSKSAPLSDSLTAREAQFIEARDGFYQATVSETGWPYVQYRGGSKGFLKVLDPQTLAYADFRGNTQYISVGNVLSNDKLAIFLMDYAQQQRLKIFGRVRVVAANDDPDLMSRLSTPGYPARIERALVIDVQAFDWNCPPHITPRYTAAEYAQANNAQANNALAQARGSERRHEG